MTGKRKHDSFLFEDPFFDAHNDLFTEISKFEKNPTNSFLMDYFIPILEDIQENGKNISNISYLLKIVKKIKNIHPYLAEEVNFALDIFGI